METKKKEVVLDIREDKKHSVCYKTKDSNAAVQSIYVMRSAFSKMPDKIKLTIEEV